MSQAFRDFRVHLPPPAECLAILLGCMQLTVFGLGGLTNPLEFATCFGVPMLPSSSTQSHPGAIEAGSAQKGKGDKVQKIQQAYIAAIAARNLQNGIVLLTMGLYLKNRTALGVMVASELVTTVADALIVQYYGVKDAIWGHVFGIVNCSLIGTSLLYWGRNDPWW